MRISRERRSRLQKRNPGSLKGRPLPLLSHTPPGLTDRTTPCSIPPGSAQQFLPFRFIELTVST